LQPTSSTALICEIETDRLDIGFRKIKLLYTDKCVMAVPYHLLQLQDGRTKALFTVPASIAQSLVVHPVLCRGAAFSLNYTAAVDDIQKSATATADTTAFIFTEFYSPVPDETAFEISQRLANRVKENASLKISNVLRL
jgi:hypothetical protein